MKRLMAAWLAVLLVLCAAAALADETADRRAAIRKLIGVTNSAELGVQMTNGLVSQLKQVFPSVPASLWDEFAASLNGEEYTAMVVPIYEKHFSLEEIEALLAFYESAAGRKFVAKMPEVLQEAMQVGNAWGRAKAEEIIRKLKERGYEPTQA